LGSVTPSTFEIALFLHLLGTMAFVSGMAVAGVCFESARRRSTATEIAMLLSLTRAGVLLVVCGAIVAGACGLWLANLGNLSFQTEWVWLSAALFVASVVLGALGGRRPRQARTLAGTERTADADAAPSVRLRGLLDDPASRACNYLAALALLAIVYLMVTRP
jgi:uncharacterized membrane protein